MSLRTQRLLTWLKKKSRWLVRESSKIQGQRKKQGQKIEKKTVSRKKGISRIIFIPDFRAIFMISSKDCYRIEQFWYVPNSLK